MSDLSHDSIDLLRSKWKDLHDVDRAREIDIIRRSDVSINQIGRELKISASLLRHLLQCLEASDEDQDLARRGQISTNELVRRAKAAKERRAKSPQKRRAEPPKEVVEAHREKSASEGADLICDWILKENLYGPDRIRIVKDVCREFKIREENHSLPPLTKHASLPLNVLIQRSKPKRPIDAGVAALSWYAEWLCRWSFYALEDPIVRDSALKQTLKRLSEK
jgi:hypothetical protein